MIDSLRRHRDRVFEADLCIVGAGPIGLAIAASFLDGPMRVLVLESGGEEPAEAIAALNEGDVVGGPFDGLEQGRARAFGGTTWLWAGQCMPLDPEALEPRSWVPGSGWPLDASDIAAEMPSAAAFLGLPADAFDERPWTERGIPAPELDPDVLAMQAAAFTPDLRIGPRLIGAFRRSQAVTTLLDATVTGLGFSAAGDAVEEARIADLGGARGTVRARSFVLCCGGIENARLLLVSGALAGRLEATGRYFQDHPIAEAAALEPLDRGALLDQFARITRTGQRRLRQLALSPRRQAEREVLGANARVVWEPHTGMSAVRRIRSGGGTAGRAVADAGRVAADLPGLAASGMRRGRGLSSAPRSGNVSLVVSTEQAPDAESRVTLGTEPDPLGVPRTAVDWRPGEPERRTMAAMAEAAGAELARLGLARARPASWLGDATAWRERIGDSAHHMGTTRMSAAPADGVVDENCGVHGVSNLFVAGTSVFPASGAANPTLPAIALALRLARRLERGVR